MVSRSVDKINTRVHARALALADGREQIVIVVVDVEVEDASAGPDDGDRVLAERRHTVLDSPVDNKTSVYVTAAVRGVRGDRGDHT